MITHPYRGLQADEYFRLPAELHKVAPEIGNGMWVKADHLVFDHRLKSRALEGPEQEAAVVISRTSLGLYLHRGVRLGRD